MQLLLGQSIDEEASNILSYNWNIKLNGILKPYNNEKIRCDNYKTATNGIDGMNKNQTKTTITRMTNAIFNGMILLNDSNKNVGNLWCDNKTNTEKNNLPDINVKTSNCMEI